jgi:hypothetical protein
MSADEVGADALSAAAERVRELAAGWQAPDFAHVPDPDCALFLCAVDHSTGYAAPHLLDGRGPFAGSELMWELGLRAHRAEGGELLRAARLATATRGEVAGWFEAGDETVADPERRAALWRDLAAGLERDHGGNSEALLSACARRLGGDGGLVALLGRYEAYSDPLAKKASLFAKICERRGWLAVADPESWEVSADNVLMRLALRSGLVAPGPLESVRPATRAAFKELAAATGLSPPILDDLLWELGRENPDLLGAAAGDLAEPPRDEGSAFY